MRRVLLFLCCLAVPFVPADTADAASASATVQVSASISSYVEVGRDPVSGTYVISNESEPWAHLVHAEPSGPDPVNHPRWAVYTQEEAQPLLWSGQAVLARREEARTRELLAKQEEERRRQQEEQAGAAGDTSASP